MRRRNLLAGTAAIATLGGCLSALPTADGAYNITVTELDSTSPYQIGPSSPNCPELRGDDMSYSWGQMSTSTTEINRPVSSPEAAGRLFLDEHETSDEATVRVPQTDHIEWKGSERNITEESATGDWYILEAGAQTTLVIPDSGRSTILRQYTPGDC